MEFLSSFLEIPNFSFRIESMFDITTYSITIIESNKSKAS